jgi:type I restriction enzyme S subunit
MVEAIEKTITLAKTTKFIVDNRGKTAPTSDNGIALIATNCVSNDDLYPTYKNVRFVSPETYSKWFRAHPQPGDILLTLKGSQNGAVCLVPDPVDFAIAQDMVALRADSTVIDPLFLFAALRSPSVQDQIKNLDVSGVIPHFKKTDFDKLLLPYPDRATQEKIGRLNFSICSKIDLNRRMNETLEAMARSIFKDWFVDFGPTRAKMEGLAPYLAPEIWALFPDRLNDEGTPEGWKIGTLDQLIEIGPSEPMRKGELTPYLEMSALPTQGPISDLPIPREYSSGTRFRNGDTLLARITPCLENGKTAFVQNLSANAVGWGSTEFIVMRSISPVPRAVSYLLAREPAFRRHAIQSMTGTSGRQRARADAISAFPVTIPSGADVWAALGSILTPTFAKIAANADETQTLAATRDLLLPKLMSGEIGLNDVEQIVQAVA